MDAGNFIYPRSQNEFQNILPSFCSGGIKLNLLTFDPCLKLIRSMAAVIVQVKKAKSNLNGESISPGPTGVARPFIDDDEIDEVYFNKSFFYLFHLY